jgi:hypothetical protein
MGLCLSCRLLADRLANLESNPDSYRLRIGDYAKTFGHNSVHTEIRRLYHEKFGQIGLDEYIIGNIGRPALASQSKADLLALEGYQYQFAVQSNWDNENNQRTYHYYTKNTDDNFWIVIMRKEKETQAAEDKVILGSFNDYDSRISRIWRAAQVAGSRAPEGKFVRKWVEDLDPESCGNNRIPSGAAFRLFKKLGLIELVETKGKTEYYRLTSAKPEKRNLDRFIQNDIKHVELKKKTLLKIPIISETA